VIGVDVSDAALELARQRLELHDVPEERFELIQVSDSKPEIPLDTESVDFFQCQGVLQHTSDPGSILKELHRVLKPGGEARVMVYNRDSVWFHLCTAYVTQILEGRYADLATEDAFQFTTDGPDCPIARCWRGEDFVALCREAGFEATFLGGYPSRYELEQLEEHRDRAIEHDRLGREHREFLRELERDENGYPTWRGKHAGVGGSYVLRKPRRGAA
jgi:SAM-dependent methyltransferase